MRLFEPRVGVDIRDDSRATSRSFQSGPLADLMAAGLVIIAAALVIEAFRKAPTSQIKSYDLIFWSGMALAYLTVMWRALTGRYGLVWLTFLGVFTLLPKFWMSPNGPIYFDETAHYALLVNVISAGHLFQSTPLLPIGTYYPGLESVTATIHWLTGMPAWASALTIIATVHCLLLVQIYYIARAMQVSHTLAVIAAMVYAVNPSFVYEDVQFAYESVAILLMLTIVRLYMEALAAERDGGRTWAQTLRTTALIAVMGLGCVVTHHLTSLTGVGLLLLAALFLKPVDGFLDRKAGARRLFLRWVPVVTFGGSFALWVAFVAPGTVPYLFPHVSQPAAALVELGKGQGTGELRTLFAHSTAPVYEQISAIGAPVLISLTALFAVIRWLWKRQLRRGSNFLWSFLLTADYLISLPLTLVAQGAAGAHRTWASTFVGVCLLPAAIVVLYELHKRRQWVRIALAAGGAVSLIVLLIGNIAAGTPTDYRFPGPYKFGSDTLSVTPETVALANWVHAHLGPQPHIIGDRDTGIALTGRDDAVAPQQASDLPIAAIWYNRRPPNPALLYEMQQQQDDYIIVDLRDTEYSSTATPLFIAGEPAKVPVTNMQNLAKWPWLKLLYSSAHYRVYKINFTAYYLWYPFHAKDQ